MFQIEIFEVQKSEYVFRISGSVWGNAIKKGARAKRCASFGNMLCSLFMVPVGTRLAFSGDYPGLMDNVLADPEAYAFDGGDVNGGLGYIANVTDLPQCKFSLVHVSVSNLCDARLLNAVP
eukprot:576784-Rhodomonas_salina.2